MRAALSLCGRGVGSRFRVIRRLHPPLPAILLMPFTAIWGMDTNQTEFSVLIGAIDAALAWILLGRLKVNLNPRVWLTVFFAMGNVLWYETVVGTTWALPMNTAL